MSQLIEQRGKLRAERVPDDATVVVRGGADSISKLRRHALRTARAWSLDGVPLTGVSVFAAVEGDVPDLLRQKFSNYRFVHLTTAGAIVGSFGLLPTGVRPHYTIHLPSTDDPTLIKLLSLLGPAQHNWIRLKQQRGKEGSR